LPFFIDNAEYDLKVNQAGISLISIKKPENTVFGFDITDIYDQKNINLIIGADSLKIFVNLTNVSRKIWLSSTLKKPKKMETLVFHKIEPTNYNYIIITDSRTIIGANNFKTYRESEAGGGHKVFVAETNQLFDHFSYGERTPLAIRRFADYMTNSSNINYLFLIGKSVSMPSLLKVKEKANQPSDDFVPTFGYPASDILLTAGLNNNLSIVSAIPTGRIAVSTDQEIINYLNKVIEHESITENSWQKNIMHLAGPGSSTEYISQFEKLELLKNKAINSPFEANPNNYQTINKPASSWNSSTNYYNSVAVSDSFYTKINNGVGIFTYLGHGSSSGTTHNFGFVSKESPIGVGGTNRYKNKGKYPFLFAAGCTIANSFSGNKDLLTDWVITPDRGAIASIGWSYLSFETYDNRTLNFVYDTWFGSNNNTNMIYSSIGDVLKQAAINNIKSFGNTNNINLNTNITQTIFTGDPSLKIFKQNPIAATPIISGEILVDSTPDGILNGTLIETNAFVSLIQQNQILRVIPVVNGIYSVPTIPDGVYKIIIGTNSNGSLVSNLLPGYTNFSGEGIIGTTGDGYPDGSFDFTITNGTVFNNSNKNSRANSGINPSFTFNKISGPLPIDLITFSGKQINNQIYLTWKVALEKAFSHFEIERSTDAKEFISIGKAAGVSQNIYNITDINPTHGFNHYRLKMVDQDGTYSFSKIINVNFETDASYLFVESPAENGKIKIYTNIINPEFRLLNEFGQTMSLLLISTEKNEYNFTAQDINSGVYFMIISSNSISKTKKILLK
jgi:hypothetical protein